MDEHHPFDLALEGRVVVIRCIGTWSKDEAIQLLSSLQELLKRLEPGVTWATLVDLSQWQPIAPDVADVANEIKALVDSSGRAHGAYLFGSLEAAQLLIEKKVIDPASTRIQYFQNEPLSREWLDSLGYFDSQEA